MTPIEELAHLLRPAGGGVHLVSTGRAAQLALQQKLYGAKNEDEVKARFREKLDEVERARAVILAVPSDVGAGFLRGANMGPQAIRTALVEEGWKPPAGVVDIGDVFVVPQLLHDEMLNEAQIEATRRALYPGIELPLPVSPLSITERALDLVLSINPKVKPFVIGGDHSNAWPVVAAIARHRPHDWGIVQPDAHTDLLEHRLGIKYCFATWSFHANDLVGGGGRLVQVGIRASARGQEHWERLGVRQFWAKDCKGPGAVDAVLAHVKATGVKGVYFSNDIDGTDDAHADATGTPEPDGLEPEFLIELIRRLGREVGLIGGDIMEVAPPIPRKPGGTERTVALAARYMKETIQAMCP